MLVGEGEIGGIGSGEMGVDSGEIEGRLVMEGSDKLGDVVGLAADTAHAGIDFKVDVDPFGAGGEGLAEIVKGIEGTDGAVESAGLGELEKLRVEADKDGASDQNRLSEGERVDFFGFFDGGDGETVGKTFGQEGNDGGGAMSVGIGLDDGTEADVGADMFSEVLGIMGEIFSADVGVHGF